jgi:DNA (cytosine-5)-methyltransferase 3A
LFWTNIEFELPEDKGIKLKDILQPDVDERFEIKKQLNQTAQTGRNETKKLGYVGEHDHQAKRVYDDGKLPALNVVCNSMVKVGYIGEGEQYGQGGQAHRVYDTEGKTPTLSSFAPLIKLGHIGNTDGQANRVYDSAGKSVTLSANGGGLGAKTGLYQVLNKRQQANLRSIDDKAHCLTSTNFKGSQANGTTLIQHETEQRIRKLTPIECERLQGLPDNYTDGIAITNRYKCLGNAFNVDVVSHILNHIQK